MATAASPCAGRQPPLVTGEPVDGPRDRGLRDEITEAPFLVGRITNAQDRPTRISLVWVVMRYRLTGFLGPAPKERRNNGHARRAGHNLGVFEVAPQAKENAYRVPLVIGLESPFPMNEPRGSRKRPETGPQLVHARILPADREDHLFLRSAPKKRCGGVARTSDDAAVPATIPLAGRSRRPPSDR